MNTTPTVCIAGVNDEPSPSWDLDEGLDVLDEVGIDIFEKLKDYITNVHVKDIREPGDTSTYCIAGDGKCGYPEIFKRLCQMNYSGCITVEPHLLHSQKFHVSGRENYMKAASRIIHLLEEAGFAVQSRRAKASPRSPA